MSLILASFPRSGVGMPHGTLQRRVWQRWSVVGCVPTPERGTDKVTTGLTHERYTPRP
jgi:adenosylcobinamide-GDP ribazoletransferase